jgi:hypothetical protein
MKRQKENPEKKQGSFNMPGFISAETSFKARREWYNLSRMLKEKTTSTMNTTASKDVLQKL